VLGVEQVTVEGFEFEDEQGEQDLEVLVVAVRPTRGRRGRCSRCDRRCPGYDGGGGRRRWRALDLGTTRVFLEADAPRVSCREHGVVVTAVPLARAGSRFTAAFEDTCAWLAARTTKTVVCELLRIT
jgi:transposase